jgi:hypothetical protein
LGKLVEKKILLKTTKIKVITIVVALDQSTVIFQKGVGYYYNGQTILLTSIQLIRVGE